MPQCEPSQADLEKVPPKDVTMTFVEVTTQVLEECGGITSVAEIQRRCTEKGFRKRDGSQIDMKYVAWGVVCYPDQLEVLVRLKKETV